MAVPTQTQTCPVCGTSYRPLDGVRIRVPVDGVECERTVSLCSADCRSTWYERWQVQRGCPVWLARSRGVDE